MQVLDGASLADVRKSEPRALPSGEIIVRGGLTACAILAAAWLTLEQTWLLWAMGMVAAVLSWTRPDLGLQLLVVLAFSIDWIAEDLRLVPPQATWAIEALVAVLAIRALWNRFPHLPARVATDLPVAALALCGAASALFHAESAWTIALGARVLLRFVIVYYALLNLHLSDRAWRRIVGLCLFLVAVQIPLGIYQFSVLGYTDDRVFGSLRSSGGLVLVLAIALAIFAARYIWQSPSIRNLLLIPAFFIVPVLGEGKGFFFLAPLPVLAIIVFGLRSNIQRTAIVAVVFLATAIAAAGSYGAVDGNADLLLLFARSREVVGFSLTPATSADQVGGAPGERFRRTPPKAWNPNVNNPAEVAIAASTWPRLEAVRHALVTVGATPATAMFGFGLGSRTFTRQEVEQGGGEILYVAPIARRLYETGFIGVALYWTLLAAAVFAGRRTRRSPDPFWRATAFALPGVAMLYAIAEVYTETQLDAPALMFWVLAAAVVSRAAADESARDAGATGGS